MTVAKEDNRLIRGLLMVQISRIRKKIKAQLSHQYPVILNYLMITENRGPKKIPINRKYVCLQEVREMSKYLG